MELLPTPDETVEKIALGKIPKNFWNLEAFGGKSAALKDIHALLVERLQYEAPDADTLELMMMERVCFLYIFMRANEIPNPEDEDASLKFDRTYKDMMSLWVSMAADLRKQRLRADEMNSIRMTIVTEVARALKEAMKDVDPAVANAVQSKLVALVAV